jgi:hypothetical protein
MGWELPPLPIDYEEPSVFNPIPFRFSFDPSGYPYTTSAYTSMYGECLNTRHMEHGEDQPSHPGTYESSNN